MKSSFSNMWLLGLVALFIFIFAGYLAVTISYSAAFKVKNEILLIIEKHDGMTHDSKPATSTITGENVTNPGAFQTINLYLYGMSYRVKSGCPDEFGWIGVTQLTEGNKPTNDTYEQAVKGKKYYYCFAKFDATYGQGRKEMNAIYYKVRLFYKMDLPVLGDLFTFNVDGTTNNIYNPNSDILG